MEKASLGQEMDLDSIILGNITGLRFQPLVNLQTGETFAWEVLAKTESNNVEEYFSALSAVHHLVVFLWQAKKVLNCTGKFWLNLPVAAYKDPFCIMQILKLSHGNQLTLEIQDPENLAGMNFLERMQFQAGIEILRRAGWKIWLDDFTEALAPDIAALNLRVEGVKIDRFAAFQSQDLAALVSAARKLAPEVLVEGIENNKMLHQVQNAGANYGQGFLWPETSVINPLDESDIEQGKLWRLEKQLTEKNQTAVAIFCADSFYQQGIYQLLWMIQSKNYYTNFIVPFRLVKSESDADTILRESVPGEKPFGCDIVDYSPEYNQGIPRPKQYIGINNTRRCMKSCPKLDGVISAYDLPDVRLDLLKKALDGVVSKKSQTPQVNASGKCQMCTKNRLTRREKDVIRHMKHGESYLLIAVRYGCTEKVVSQHKRSIMRKLNLKSNMDFYRYLNHVSFIEDQHRIV